MKKAFPKVTHTTLSHDASPINNVHGVHMLPFEKLKSASSEARRRTLTPPSASVCGASKRTPSVADPADSKFPFRRTTEEREART